MAITSVNLALTNRCTANCIFCPASRGTRITSDMPVEIVHKILDEISSPTFPWKVTMISVGENGDAPLHKDFLEILRVIRAKMPSAKVTMSTNFSRMKSELSKILLDERLLDTISLNIDGHDAASYTAQKRLKYSNVINNLKSFVEQRKNYNNPVELIVHFLPLREYVDAVYERFGKLPSKLVNEEVPYSDETLIRESLSWLPKDVIIDHPACFFWADRALLPQAYIESGLQEQTVWCPNYTRVESEAWIAPNGDWYACCLDDNQELVWGNVMKNSLVEIHNSKTRLDFLDDLIHRRWQKLGHPCNTVACCWSPATYDTPPTPPRDMQSTHRDRSMNILFVAPPIPDFLADSLLHGLRALFGNTVVDVPKAEQMYVNAPPRSFHGRGFTLYKTLYDEGIDRTDIAEKIKSRFFDVIVYGCVSSCYPENEILHHWDLVKENYPVNKILLVDGADPTTVKHDLIGHGVYFKREIPDNSPLRNVLVPISFSIPAEKIFLGSSNKTYVVAPLVPGIGATYIYYDEASYYRMYQQSMFALTWKKAGWDCLRHYEIIAQGALPLFLDIYHLPQKTMIPWPREDTKAILKINDLSLGDFDPSMVFKYDDRNTITNVNFNQFTFDMKGQDEYIEMSQKMRMYLLDNLTTEHVAKYLCAMVGQ